MTVDSFFVINRRKKTWPERMKWQQAVASEIVFGAGLIMSVLVLPATHWISIRAALFWCFLLGLLGWRGISFYTNYMNRKTKTTYQRAVREGYRICAYCLYSLRGLPDEGQCPECGMAYALDKQPALWDAIKPEDHKPKKQKGE